jgi:type II pantothenate kinase
MRAAVDFGLTNIDVVVQAEESPLQYFTIPTEGDVDASQLRRALRAAGYGLEAFSHIGVTGGQHRRLPGTVAGRSLTAVDEVAAIGRGGLYLSQLPEALVVSAGSGTAIVAARRGDVHHATGSAVGGGTLQGLSHLLLGTADPGEIDGLAGQGDSNGVDLSLLEATGGTLGRLPADANAVNFGRVARMSHVNPAWQAKREDIAAGLVLMIGQVIAVIAINAARAEGLERIVMVGHLVDMPSVRRVLKTVAGYYAADIIFPDAPGYATAIGALVGLLA